MAAQRVVTEFMVTPTKVTVAFGPTSAEYLYAPCSLVRHESLGDDRSAVVVASSSGLRAYLVTDQALRSLDPLPRAPHHDPITTDPKVDFMIEALRSASRGEPEPSGEPKVLAAPSQGTLSTDGTFLTLEIDGTRTHFVVARDALPQVQGAPVPAPDGSHSVALRLPDRSVARFRVAPDHAIDLEKALALLRSYEPAAPTAPRSSAPARPGAPRPAPKRPTYTSREHPNGTTILVMGILGLVMCGPLAVVAWVMGNTAQREMDSERNVTWTNRSTINAGRTCGIIGTVLWIIFAIIWVLFINAAKG